MNMDTVRQQPVKFYSGLNRSEPIYMTVKGVTFDVSSRKYFSDQSNGASPLNSYDDILDTRYFKEISRVIDA